jgi:hypothetical protein
VEKMASVEAEVLADRWQCPKISAPSANFLLGMKSSSSSIGT